MSDDGLAAKYAAHLAYELGKIKSVDTSVDMEEVLADLQTANILKKSSSVQNAVLALLPDSTRALYLAAANNNAGSNTGTGDPLGGLNIGNLFGGTGSAPIQAELRYFITVSMSYDEELILAEQARKGLDYTQKVSKLEVSQ